MSNVSRLSDLRQQIKVLALPAPERATTEADAYAAIARVSTLVAEHRALAIAVTAEPETFKEVAAKHTLGDPVCLVNLLRPICDLTGCNTFTRINGDGNYNFDPTRLAGFNLFGYDTDIKLATYLYTLAKRAVLSQTSAYVQSQVRAGRPGDSATAYAFASGMTDRIVKKLRAMQHEKEQAIMANPQQMSAYADRRIVIEREFLVRHPDLGKGITLRRGDDHPAYGAGAAHGDAVDLSLARPSPAAALSPEVKSLVSGFRGNDTRGAARQLR